MTSVTLPLYQKKGAIIKIISSFLGVMQRPLYLLARLVSAKLNKWFFFVPHTVIPWLDIIGTCMSIRQKRLTCRFQDFTYLLPSVKCSIR